MLYLVRKKKPKVAHIFIDGDTACRLYSTGGLAKRRYRMSPDPYDQPICVMCANVAGLKPAKTVKCPELLHRQQLDKLVLEQKKDMRTHYVSRTY